MSSTIALTETVAPSSSCEELNIKVSRSHKNPSPLRFAMLPELTRRERLSMNVYKVLQSLSANANTFYWFLVENRNTETNKTMFVPEKGAEANRTTKAIKELKGKGMAVRAKQGVYLISPFAMMPKVDKFEDVKAEWLRLNP